MASSWWRQLKDAVRRSAEPGARKRFNAAVKGGARPGPDTARMVLRGGLARGVSTPGTLWHPGVSLQAKHGGTFRALPEHTLRTLDGPGPEGKVRVENVTLSNDRFRMIGYVPDPSHPRHRDRFLALAQEEEDDDEYEEEEKKEEEERRRIVRERETEKLSVPAPAPAPATATAPAPAPAAAAATAAAAIAIQK